MCGFKPIVLPSRNQGLFLSSLSVFVAHSPVGGGGGEEEEIGKYN